MIQMILIKKRNKHANAYYQSVRRRNKKIEIDIISRNTKLNKNLVKRAYEHLFINKYSLDGGINRFHPDYYITVSWQRLREGKILKSKTWFYYVMKPLNIIE